MGKKDRKKERKIERKEEKKKNDEKSKVSHLVFSTLRMLAKLMD